MHSAEPFTRRIWPRLLASLALLMVVPALADSVAATDQGPTVSIGESNSQVQQEEVLGFLGAATSDRMVTVTVDETVQSMGEVFDVSGINSAFSSTALSCRADRSGITVTTRNIEVIPPELYALALVTAGMSDVQLAVAAPNDAPALGMTAMTGVFKTWDLAACSVSGSDPARRRLALEQLALIAEIGQDPEAIRQTTLAVLAAQEEIIESQPTIDELDAIVSAQSEAAGLEPSDEDRAAIVAFLERLSRAEIDWEEFTHGWSTQYVNDGSGVVLKANDDPAPAVASTPIPTGVGGATGPVRVAASPSVPASPIATEASPVASMVVSTPTLGDNSGPTFMGTVMERSGDAGRWWPVAAGIVGLFLLGIGTRLKPSETAKTWFVSRSRRLWLGRTLRRPPIVQSPRHRKGYAVVTRKR